MTGSKNQMPSHAVVTRLTPTRLLATLFLLIVSSQSLALYTPQIYSKRGAVYAREIIKVDVNGESFPVYVEYDESGSEIPGGIYQVDNLPNGQRYVVYSGERYRSFINQYEQLKAGYAANGMAEPELLSRTDFLNNLNSGVYTTYTGDPAVTGQPITLGDLSLRDDTVMVAIAPEKARLSTDAKQLLQIEFPVDVSAEATTAVANYRTLLLKIDEQQYTSAIVEKSFNNIGYRVGFYGRDGVASTSGRSYNDEIYGPLVDVPVSTTIGLGYDRTDAQGKYRFQYMLPACPGFTFEYYTPTYVELYYKRFNPQAREVMPYYLTKPGWDFCNGLAAFPPSYSLTGLMTQVAVADIVNSAATVNVTTDFPIDFMVLSGRAFLSNDPAAAPLSETPYEHSGVIPVGESTRYDSSGITRSETQRAAQDNYDLDGDGRADFTELGRVQTTGEGEKQFIKLQTNEIPEVQGIWLSSLHSGLPAFTDGVAGIYPDLTRLPDWSADHNHRALLSQITAEDLQDTDIYVFRESDDSLLMERKGLNANNLDLGVDEGLGKFVYTIRIIDNRGRLNDGYAVSDSVFRQWQIDEGVVDEALYAKQADHLRPGERVRLIAINRVSGYLGSLSVPLKAASEGSNDVEVSFAIDDITLLPPNLRVWAERKTRTELGMTRGEINDYLVGSEGAALSDDYYLAIYFEWLAPDGSPLPLDLYDYGYTARLARIASENALETVNAIDNVPVRPGKQMALIRLPESAEGIGTEHYYVQVSGQPTSRESDFVTLAEEGMLKYRPAKFVPLLTPVYDEEATNLATQAWNLVRRSDATLQRPEPVYKWLYRPEYQFSVYGLQMNEIKRQDLQGEAENILESVHPVISPSDQSVELLYNLIMPGGDELLSTLDAYSYGGDKELVFSFAGQEATVEADGTVVFDDPSIIGSLNAEDYLTLRMYASNDPENILWEWAFGKGLLVSYKLPHVERYVSPVDDDGTNLYRTLGGLRLKYSYKLPPNAEPIAYLWSFHPQNEGAAPGRFCTDYGVATTSCWNKLTWSEQDAGTDTPQETIYWEPPSWTTDVNYIGSVVAQYRVDGVVQSAVETFRVASRELGPDMVPIEGSDVAMLEEMLWQLGISPQKSGPAINSNGQAYTAYKAGSEGARIDSDRGGNSGWTLSCTGEPADDRSVFYLDQPNCPTARVATELMVKRFNARNLEDETVVTLREVNNAGGNVDLQTLSWLKRDWRLYTAAFEELQDHTVFERNTGEMVRWIAEAVDIWESGSGETVPATLTEANYNAVLRAAGLADNARSRSDLLIGWLEEETRYHWGDNLKHYQSTHFRMVEGGADENGSLSFSQLLYHYRFGPNPCAAHGEAQLNLYHPAGNMRTMVIHTASDATNGANTQNCQGGLHRAFVTNTLRIRYDQGGNMADLRGYINNATGAVVALNVANREGDYEALAKGIGIYNGNGAAGSPIFTANSWPKLLKTMEYRGNSTRNSATVCHSCKYSILVRNKARVLEGNLRRYVWNGGNTAEGQPWCFVYGESEWASGQTFENIFTAAEGNVSRSIAPVGRIDCVTGATL